MKNKNILKNRNIILVVLTLINLFYFGVKVEYTIATFLHNGISQYNYFFLLPEIILIITSMIYLVKVSSNLKDPKISIKNIIVYNILIFGSIIFLFSIIWYYTFIEFYNTGFGFQAEYFQTITLYFVALIVINVSDILFKITFLYKRFD